MGEQEQQIMGVVQAYIHAIHTQDKEEFYSIWAKKVQCTLLSITSEFQALDRIYEDFLIGKIRARYASIDLIPDAIRIDRMRDDLAIVVFRYRTECILRESGQPYGIQGLETQVLIKEDGQWRLCHVHYSK